MADKVVLTGVVTEQVDVGGDVNLKIENGGEAFWMLKSKLDKFSQMGHENSIQIEVEDLEPELTVIEPSKSKRGKK